MKTPPEPDRAISDALRAIELSRGREPGPYYTIGWAYYAKQDWNRMLASFDTLVAKWKKEGIGHDGRGIALYALGRYEDAIAAFTAALPLLHKPEDRSSHDQALWYRGLALVRLQRHSEALQDFDSVRFSQALIPSWWELEHRGVAEWKLGRIDEARADANSVVRAKPRLLTVFDGDSILQMFDLAARERVTRDAIAAAEAAEAHQDWLEAFNSWNKAWGQTDYDDEESTILSGIFRTYVKLATKPDMPEKVRRFFIQAETYRNARNLDAVAWEYFYAEGVAPWYPPAYSNRAMVESELGHYMQAAWQMQNYLRLAPDAPDARQAQDLIYEWQAKAH